MVDFEKSDKGAKAAWKGFSSQTTYIASRLIDLPEDVELHPEKVEDLLISSEKNSIELVQIKNLTSPLTLSDLKPKDSDSFFRRCLSIRDDNPDIILKIVSFGEIGKELSNFSDSSTIEYFNIEKKLISMSYKKDEIQWISNRLSFEIVDEEKLINQIKESFSKTVEIMAAPEIVLDILTQYVAKLSRYSEYTSKINWNKKIQQIGIDLAALRGISKEFGNSFIPIAEYKDQKTKEQLSQEYLAGINAQPQHI